jgi:hypothetical protein
MFRNHRGQNRGLAIGDEDGAIGLAGDTARFKGQLAAAPFDGLAFNIKQ